MRSTKVVATLGPASDGMIDRMVATGVDVFRLNFSHGDRAEHRRRAQRIREAAANENRFVAILADLQGPKIRTGGLLEDQGVVLTEGAHFCIDAAYDDHKGDAQRVGTTYKSLADEVFAGDTLVLGDGLIELTVSATQGSAVNCVVNQGGVLRSNQGINKRGGGLSAPALTAKDKEDLKVACELGADYIAISFPRSADDMNEARALVDAQGYDCGLVAKLERAEVVKDEAALAAIVKASDAVMVARGDLGIEIGDAALMGVQKNIIMVAQRLGRSVITATQMMESMIQNPSPTRAEVMDVANAVIDGSDALMLSGETAIGAYPADTVARMIAIIEGAETTMKHSRAPMNIGAVNAIDDGIAMAAMFTADRLARVRAIACLTSSGNTPKLMSRVRGNLPIYALASAPATLAKMALYRGVHPRFFDTANMDFEQVNETVVEWLVRDQAVKPGDRAVLTKGDYQNAQGGTNTMKIVEVPG